MESSLGLGLGALGFWLFIAAAVLATYWDNIRKRESQHETMRRIIESQSSVDEALLQRLMNVVEGRSGRPDRDMKVAALWILPTSVGVAAFAVILSMQVAEALYPLLGAALLLASLGIGFLIASRVVTRWIESEQD